MSSRSHERRTERATAEEVAEVERQLWEFAKRIDPPGVPEANLRPGAFLWRVHRTWHSLGRGTGGLASRSFRALRDELLNRDPPVRNLQPKLYGNAPLAHAEAEQLVDAMLETWHLERGRNGKWQAGPLIHPQDSKAAERQDLETIRENMLHTVFKGDDHIFLEEPVGVPPEIFVEERGRSSLAYIVPTKGETTAHLSPSNIYGGFSNSNEKFMNAALQRLDAGDKAPLLVWVLRLDVIRDNAEFHQSFHSLAVYFGSLTNWYFRLCKRPTGQNDENLWRMITEYCAFVVYGLPSFCSFPNKENTIDAIDDIDGELAELSPNFMVPYSLPIVLKNHHQVRKHQSHDFAMAVSLEPDVDSVRPNGGRLNYWLFPDRPRGDLEETAETTGLPVFDAEMSPGGDFDLAYTAIYEAAAHHLGLAPDERSKLSHRTLNYMGWAVLNVEEFQESLLISNTLKR